MPDPRIRNLRDFPHRSRFRIDLPTNVVRIDRRSPWGNPYVIGDHLPASAPMDRARAIGLFRVYVVRHLTLEPTWLEPLRGMELACWCSPAPCHGEVILEVLDAESVAAWLEAQAA